MHLRRILHMQLSIFSLLYTMSDYEHFVAREAYLTGHPKPSKGLFDKHGSPSTTEHY